MTTARVTDQRLSDLLEGLRRELQKNLSIVVAFSGGADSAFLLAAAARYIGRDKVVAATAVSPSLPVAELERARDFASHLRVRHVMPRTDELARSGYRANGRDRCFHCKSELLSVLTGVAADLGMAAIATGTNSDDARDRYRPGIRAAARAGAITPLLDAGLTKADVRALSRRWNLVTADKPAAACLSSRVAYGLEISSLRLARIERAEADLRTALEREGIAVENLRVRDLGDRASVEVDLFLVPKLLARPELLDSVSGFPSVEVDVRGFRSGSMNETLIAPAP